MLGLGLSLPAYKHFKKEENSQVYNLIGESSHISIVSIETIEEAKMFKDEMGDLPMIHHLSNVAPSDVDGPDLERMNLMDEISQVLKAKWCLEDIGAWSLSGYPAPYFIPTILDKDWAKEIVHRVKRINNETSSPFLLEVPSFSFIAGDMSLPEFFNFLCNETGNDIVLDVSHIFSYSIATGKNYLSVLAELDLKRVKEIHIAGGRVNKKFSYRYIDSHSDPILPECFQLLESSLESCENLEAVTFEVSEFQSNSLILEDFEKIKRVLR